MNRQDQNKQWRQHEIRNGNPQHSDSHHAVVDSVILSNRSKRPKRDAHNQRQQHGASAKLKRDGKSGADQLRDGQILILKRRSKVAARDAPQVISVLLVKRIVAMVLSLKLGLHRGRQLPFGVEWSARREADEK